MDKPSTTAKADDRAVSPVIGVVLLIAITVALAAAVGVLVIGATNSATDALGTDAEPNMTVTFSGENVTVTHQGGGDVPAAELVIDGDVADSPVQWDEYGTVSTGDSVTLNTTSENPVVYVLLRDSMGQETLLVKASA